MGNNQGVWTFNMPIVLSTDGVKYGINGPQRFACDSSLKRGQAVQPRVQEAWIAW